MPYSENDGSPASGNLSHSCPPRSSRKVYVEVTADFDAAGNMLPRVIFWRNGRRYVIDRVTNVCHAASSKAGGHGDRYTVMIRGKITYLFFERNYAGGGPTGRWFVAQKAGEY